MTRTITYIEAIREATDQIMESNQSVLLFGLDVDDPKAILGSTKGLAEKYGKNRVFGTPLSEDAMTGIAVGMAMAGLRPIHVHIRMDFLMLAMNQLINVAAKTHYMHGGQENVPLVVRAIIGKSWGQGAQHSQALYSFFMHVPGIKVIAPTTPYDAKGGLIEAVLDDNPVLFVEHRLLHGLTGPVPENVYSVKPGKARLATVGEDITLVGISHAQIECLKAEEKLRRAGIRAEVIDPVWLSPLDIDTIVDSVRKTRRILVVDNAWLSCGASAEITSQVVERLQGEVDVRVGRMGFAPTTCPTTPGLERLFYPASDKICSEAGRMIHGKEPAWLEGSGPTGVEEPEFKGPF